MAKMNPTQKKAFLARMAKGRRSAGAASSRAVRSYRIHNDSSGQDLGVYRGASSAAAIRSMLRDAGDDGPVSPNLRATLVRSAAKGRRSAGVAAGRVAGAMVKRRKPAPKRKAGAAGMMHAKKPPKRKAGAAMKRLPAVLPKRKNHPRGMVGGGTPAVRLARIETAVTDLARANHAIVSKVVEHERRLTSAETTLSNWARGRK